MASVLEEKEAIRDVLSADCIPRASALSPTLIFSCMKNVH